jgi:RimJ/RimL family protein N-acetyltransferase
MRQMYAAPTSTTSALWAYLQKRKFYSVLRDGEVVGGFNFYDIHDSRACFGVVTHPAFRGKGLGRKLVRLMKAEAKHLGYRTLRADIYLDNKPCLALVKKTGFRQFVWVETNV